MVKNNYNVSTLSMTRKMAIPKQFGIAETEEMESHYVLYIMEEIVSLNILRMGFQLNHKKKEFVYNKHIISWNQCSEKGKTFVKKNPLGGSFHKCFIASIFATHSVCKINNGKRQFPSLLPP